MSQMKDPNQIIKTDSKTGRVSVITINKEPTKTQQQFKEECDINNIMKKYSTTGEFLHVTSKQGVYADFSGITDYREMLDTVNYANEAFASLPAEVRTRFRNDPHELLTFVQNKQNYEEGVKLGLIPTPPNQTNEQTKPTPPNQTNEQTKPTTPVP